MITYKNENKVSLQSLESSMPVLAMCYDFDKTLTPDDMQAQGFINLLAMMKSKSNSSGKNLINWLRKMIWIIIWLICTR